MLNPSMQCDGTSIWKWGLWGVIRSWGWGPQEWDECPYIRDPRERPRPFCQGRTQWQCMNQEAGSHQTPNLPASWSWTSQPPGPWEVNFSCLQALSLWESAPGAWADRQKGSNQSPFDIKEGVITKPSSQILLNDAHHCGQFLLGQTNPPEAVFFPALSLKVISGRNETTGSGFQRRDPGLELTSGRNTINGAAGIYYTSNMVE